VRDRDANAFPGAAFGFTRATADSSRHSAFRRIPLAAPRARDDARSRCACSAE
jgi:hypothetical protein